jgi:hypothetical protein
MPMAALAKRFLRPRSAEAGGRKGGLGAQAYVTGEIGCHIATDYGRPRLQQMGQFAESSSMTRIGVSHAASEYLVLKTALRRWLVDHFDVLVRPLPQSPWRL